MRHVQFLPAEGDQRLEGVNPLAHDLHTKDMMPFKTGVQKSPAILL